MKISLGRKLVISVDYKYRIKNKRHVVKIQMLFYLKSVFPKSIFF